MASIQLKHLLLPTSIPSPPAWAGGYGADAYGVFAELAMGTAVQRLRWMPQGAFMMGSPDDEALSFGDERPQHWVEITPGFWLGETPVTQAFYQAIMGTNPSRFTDRPDAARRPVEQVSWADCQALLMQLNGRLPPLALDRFRLPSEAEWEYACRAGSTSAFSDDSACTAPEGQDPALDRLGWYSKNRGGETHPVQEKAPNAWGLYDQHGNVWEWCDDHWHDNYAGAPVDGRGWVKEGAAGNARRVVRGGSWYGPARDCRSASRFSFVPGDRYDFLGFRLLCAPSSTTGSDGRPPAAVASAERGDGGAGRPPPVAPARSAGGAGGVPPADES